MNFSSNRLWKFPDAKMASGARAEKEKRREEKRRSEDEIFRGFE